MDENLSNISNLRKEYKLNILSEENVSKNPFKQFNNWFQDVLKSGVIEPNAMILATSNKKSNPSARTVLLKNFNEKEFLFFTNYKSRKGKELKNNPFASLLFYWPELQRQVRIEGKIKKVSREMSAEYFHSRPRDAQIAAWVSNQSSKVSDRKFLDARFEELKKKFGNDEIPLPDYWGGFRLIPDYFEFWQGRENRLHDRICYDLKNKKWKISRLAP
ncbi:MAG TPA: pyridoxamine 5'-phosphate oxidase [Ignavibacteriaceae bacterium]